MDSDSPLLFLDLYLSNNVDFSNLDSDIESILDNVSDSSLPRPSPNKPIGEWNNQEVMQFIENQLVGLDYQKNIDGFLSISGNIFKGLNKEYCSHLAGCSILGELIYNAKELLLKEDETNFPKESTITQSNPVRPALHEANHDEVPSKTKSGRSQRLSSKVRKRSEKLWEFLINLLHDSKTCPRLIKWEDFQEGTFRFVQNDTVAKLWGNRKKNHNMNYEKFSRAMRYYYKSKVLLPVPGKRLVYKFGPHATGWKSSIPLN